jgi:hypothetical protein
MTNDSLSDLLGPGPASGGGRRAQSGTDTNPGSDPMAGSDPTAGSGPMAGSGPVPPGPDDPYDEDITEIPPHRRLPLLTACLLASIALGLAFTGGVVVQKRHDSGSTTTASGFPSGMPGFPGGSGGIPNGMSGFPGMGSAAGSGTGTGGNTGASEGASSGPVLIGTVVKVDSTNVTVKDLSGKTYVVRTTTSTTVTRSTSTPLTGLKTGDTVSVEGTKSGQNVSATAVTDRGQ